MRRGQRMTGCRTARGQVRVLRGAARAPRPDRHAASGLKHYHTFYRFLNIPTRVVLRYVGCVIRTLGY